MFSLLIALVYLAFISLGLPDSLLGSAWPVISEQFGVDKGMQGLVTMLIAGGTIVSSLMSDFSDEKNRYGIGYGYKRAAYGCCVVGVQYLQRIVANVSVGNSLRTGRRRGGRRSQQLRRSAFFFASPQLVALLLGCRLLHKSVHHGRMPWR